MHCKPEKSFEKFICRHADYDVMCKPPIHYFHVSHDLGAVTIFRFLELELGLGLRLGLALRLGLGLWSGIMLGLGFWLEL